MFYRAVVTNNQDPEKMGRCQLKIIGIHDEGGGSSWAERMGSTDFGLNNGVGISSALQVGTWVWCFLDHDNPNTPVIIGTIIDSGDFGDAAAANYATCQMIKTSSGHTIILDGAGGNDIEIKHSSGSVLRFSGPNILIDAEAGGGNVTIKGVKIDLN
jgi:hypothetical protein